MYCRIFFLGHRYLYCCTQATPLRPPSSRWLLNTVLPWSWYLFDVHSPGRYPRAPVRPVRARHGWLGTPPNCRGRKTELESHDLDRKEGLRWLGREVPDSSLSTV